MTISIYKVLPYFVINCDTDYLDAAIVIAEAERSIGDLVLYITFT